MPEETAQTIIVLDCRSVTSEGQSDGDESSCFELAYLVYDRSHNKIVSSLEKIVEPDIPEKNDDPPGCLSSETELTEGKGLRGVLQQLDLHLGKQRACVVTCGPLALRHFIHPYAKKEKVQLHEGLFSYFDISVQFKQTFPQHDEDADDIHHIASHLNIDLASVNPQGLELCKIILRIMQQLPTDCCRQIIQSQYSQIQRSLAFIFEIGSAPLQEDTIIRARGFSPNTTEFKLARFFTGLNIESGGIIMYMGVNGRPGCEALVRFTDKEQRDLALKRNGSKFGSRNIEICKTSVQEFSRLINQDHAPGLPHALTNFLLLATPAAVIIRMRGLPYNAKASEIVTFFGDESPVYRGHYGILFVYHPDRRPTGDAFVLFETVEHGKQALMKHRQTIGKRYVELFQTTRHEMIQVFTRHTFPNSGIPFPLVRAMRPITPDPSNIMQTNNHLSNNKDIIRLRGLPYAASVQDILDFLKEFGKYVVPAGVHMVYNLQGRPSGDAFIEMSSAEHAQKASETLHKKHIGERYIEVFQCSSSDMAFMLTHGIPSYRHQQQHNSWINGPYSPRTPPLVHTAFTYPPVSSSALNYPSVSSSALNYPPVSSPPTVQHTSNMISVPSSPTLSPTARVFVASPSPGYVTYSSPPYNVFNFTYPPSTVAVDTMTHTPPVMSPTPYEPTVFFPSYQVNPDYSMAQMESPLYVPVNHYIPPTNGYYPPNETNTETGHMPAYVETYSG